MAQQSRKTSPKSYCFRGIQFQIGIDELPEAVQESRRFHAALVQELVSHARYHARLLSRQRVHRESAALVNG